MKVPDTCEVEKYQSMKVLDKFGQNNQRATNLRLMGTGTSNFKIRLHFYGNF